MSRKSSTIEIKANTMKWIVDTSGCTVEELSSKLNVLPTDIETWTSINTNISLAKLKKFAKYIKRPLAVFFLDQPPQESDIPDYRTCSNKQTHDLTLDTVVSIRNVRYLRSIAKELMEIQNMNLEPKINSEFTVKMSPDKAAQIERKNLDLDNTNSKDKQILYDFLREKIESLNIFVFQASLPTREIRGLSLSDALPRVLLVRSGDALAARIFTLMHEYGHILLENGGICVPGYESKSNVESWCNSFAAGMLVPKDEFLKQYDNLEENNTPDDMVQLLSNEFKTSKLVIIIRIKMLLKHEYPRYQSLQSNIYYEKEHATNKIEKTTVRPNQITLCINRKGKRFIELVLNSKENDFITSSDVTDYLDLNVQHVEEIQHIAL